LNNINPPPEEEPLKQSDIRESEIMLRMSMYYSKSSATNTSFKTKAKIMTVKPNKERNIKAQY